MPSSTYYIVFVTGNYKDSLSDAKVAADLQPCDVDTIVRGMIVTFSLVPHTEPYNLSPNPAGKNKFATFDAISFLEVFRNRTAL